MNTAIKLNRIQSRLNMDEINKKYDFFYLETCKRYIRSGAYILDLVLLENDIKAIKFESGKKMLVMLDSNTDNLKKLKTVLDHIDEGTKFSISKVNAKDITEWNLYQILLNALGTYDTDALKFNNLTGHLYCYHEAWLQHGRDKNEDIVWKVPTLEISVNSEMALLLNVRTFTSERLKKEIVFQKKKFEDYPQYIFSVRKTLRRKLSTDTESGFIMRQTKGAKKEIPFLDIQSLEKFEKTKMGVLQDIVRRFNDKYYGLAEITFSEVKIAKKLDYSKKCAREDEQAIASLINEHTVVIVDQIGDDYSKQYCEKIAQMITEQYQIKAAISKRMNKNKLNIALIHNAEYYDGKNDPYFKRNSGIPLQHITLEDYEENSKFALASVMNELLIKNDLKQGKITLFDWKSLGFAKNMIFGVEDESDDGKHYYFMTISPDGSFSMKEQKLTLFEMNEYSEYAQIFEESKSPGECVRGIIKTAEGQINIIKDTGLFAIPEIDHIKLCLQAGDNKLRGKKRREELLASCLDIKLFEENGSQYYFVGTIGDGMRAKIQRAVAVRRIEAYADSTIVFDKLLPLMNVSFVHNKQLTVVPFPFKYLREYIKEMNK